MSVGQSYRRTGRLYRWFPGSGVQQSVKSPEGGFLQPAVQGRCPFLQPLQLRLRVLRHGHGSGLICFQRFARCFCFLLHVVNEESMSIESISDAREGPATHRRTASRQRCPGPPPKLPENSCVKSKGSSSMLDIVGPTRTTYKGGLSLGKR